MTEQNTPHEPGYPRARVLTPREHDTVLYALALATVCGGPGGAEAMFLLEALDGPYTDIERAVRPSTIGDIVIRLMDHLVDHEHNDEVGRVLMSFITGLMRRAPGLLGGLDMMTMVMGPIVPPMLAAGDGPALSLDELIASLTPKHDDDQGDEQ